MRIAIHDQAVEVSMSREEYSDWDGCRGTIDAAFPLLLAFPDLTFGDDAAVQGDHLVISGRLGFRGDEGKIAEDLARVLVHRALHDGARWITCLEGYEVGVQCMARDILAVRAGRETRESLFDSAPAEDIEDLESWGEYVDAVCAAAE